MKLTEFFAQQLDREVPISRRVLARVPEGRPDWKPHEKSMQVGYLATLVATMPSWLTMAIAQDTLDLAPTSGPGYKAPEWRTNAELLGHLEAAAASAREALAGTTDRHLATAWRLLVAGRTVAENPRHVVIADTLCHAAHHRGQLTVYLRLLDIPVPSVYGPSADERTF